MTPAEMRRRAAHLYHESRNAADPALARLLMLRSVRMTAAAGRLEEEQGADVFVFEDRVSAGTGGAAAA